MNQDTSKLKKTSILDLDLQGKKVLVRVDYNVPMSETKILDNQKIMATVGTIKCLLEKGAYLVILASHLGEESGHKNKKLSLEPVAEELEKVLELPVIFINECLGPEVENTCSTAASGTVILLENLKFHIEEEGKAEEDSRKIKVEKASLQMYQDSLSKLASIFVNDAFSLTNQLLCSVNNLTIETKVCGLYLKKELESFYRLLEKPQLPFLAIFGGLKISNKIAIIENLIDKVTDLMLVGPACLTYMKVVNKTEIDKMLVEEDAVKAVIRIHEKAKLNKINVYLPVDFMISDKSEEKGMVGRAKVKDGIKGEVLDIGQESVKKFSPIIARSKSFLWFGAPGRWEWDSFSKGTEGLTNMIVAATRRGAFSLVVGEETAQALMKFKSVHKMSHVSFSGNACLDLLEGKFLPGLAHLQPAVE